MKTIQVRGAAVRGIEKLVREREEILGRQTLPGDVERLARIIHELAAHMAIACKDYWDEKEVEGEQ